MEKSIIKLSDLLKFEDLQKVKVRFNQFNGIADPMDEYTRNPDIVNNRWLFWRTEQRLFKVGETAICLLKLSADIWLLTTVKIVTEDYNIKNGINYNGVEIEKFNPFYGRILIKYHKQFQSQCRYVADIFDDFEVLQILPSVFEGDDFPGYDNVRLSFRQLETIVNRHKRDWVAALENQKAVYLIRDCNNCKLYVGSATGDNGMLLQRWKNYIKNGHGGNKELFEIVLSNGFDYVKANFQYSILENYNAKVANEFVLKRETWWKETLGTRNPMSGYNCN